MRMEKRKFRIGELAQQLSVERFVIRFWEKEFGVKTTRSHGGQRFYDEDDLAIFTQIKDLLYNQGFTISGAKKQLGTPKGATRVVASQKTTMPRDNKIETIKELRKENERLSKQIVELQQHLKKLRALL